MNCDEAGRLLNAHADDELGLECALAVEEHLARCARCRAAWAGQMALRAAIARSCEPEPAPRRLRAKVRRLLGEAIEAPPRRRPWLGWLTAAPGIAALAAAGWLLIAQPWKHDAAARGAELRVVFHIAGTEHVGASLRTLKNHLDAEPHSRVVVVAHNSGVEFLLRGARDEAGRQYEELVRGFRERGVEFRVCTNTLTRRHIDLHEVIPEATLVPSGIAEISRLQGKEGYVYLRL